VILKTDKIINGWTVIAVLLVLVIIAGGLFIGLNYRRGGPVEISLMSPPVSTGEICIGGDVQNPGYYSLYEGDDIEGLIAAAGGITGDSDLKEFELIISDNNDGESPQLININTADDWLLEALPGIGAVKARAIIEYREQNGPFRNIQELTGVEGIGPDSFERIRHLITVAD
jgi:competence protein ComEA